MATPAHTADAAQNSTTSSDATLRSSGPFRSSFSVGRPSYEQSLEVIGDPDGGCFVQTDSTDPGVAAETEALLDETCRG